jgi:hypothetical protein
MTTRADQLLEIARQLSSGQVPAHQHNECFTSGAFDLLIVHAQDGEAFDLLQELCGRMPSERARGGSLSGYYQLISQLARQTHTTQMPEGMAQIIAADAELSKELQAWYRITDPGLFVRE